MPNEWWKIDDIKLESDKSRAEQVKKSHNFIDLPPIFHLGDGQYNYPPPMLIEIIFTFGFCIYALQAPLHPPNAAPSSGLCSIIPII